MPAMLSPICLDYNDRIVLRDGFYGQVAGFGKTIYGSLSAILRKLEVPYVSFDQCRSLNNTVGMFGKQQKEYYLITEILFNFYDYAMTPRSLLDAILFFSEQRSSLDVTFFCLSDATLFCSPLARTPHTTVFKTHAHHTISILHLYPPRGYCHLDNDLLLHSAILNGHSPPNVTQIVTRTHRFLFRMVRINARQSVIILKGIPSKYILNFLSALVIASTSNS
ncbi:hypothetical protein K0M31_006896 [Melipona bicolor]|uniref:Uncharacterized protein n=1 Tax=Melipona bicolor TaxID=60889 RepID=A0AA40KLH9_9HYME|nr:hypothetical protein K0M31_006896 [Melipona bicolor]